MKKRILLLLSMAFVAVLTIGFVSCKTDDSIPSPEVKTVKLPGDFSAKTYTGERLYADVTEETGYTVINEGGVSAGEYPVVYRLNEGYVWEDKTTAPIIKNFSILTADNAWIEACTTEDAVYGESVNVSAKAKFGEVQYEWYKGNAKLPASPVNVGEYSVFAIVEETNDYFGLKSEKKTVKIKQVQNEWLGLFDGGETEFSNDYSYLAKAKFGEVSFVWYDEAGGALAGNPKKEGSYQVVAKVTGTENYAGIESEKISVVLVKAQNEWTDDFSVGDSEWGETLKISATPKAGQARYRYYNHDGEELTAPPTEIGEYFVEAYVEETESYSALKSERKAFAIKQKQVDLTYRDAIDVLLKENKHFDFDSVVGETIGTLKIGADGTKFNYNSNVTLSKNNVKAGVYIVFLYNEKENTVYALNVRFLTDRFSQNDSDRMFTAINADPSGYYILDGDIDFSNTVFSLSASSYGYNNYYEKGVKPTNLASIVPAFSGTFDGCGYAIKNLKFKSISKGLYSTATVFGEVTGTIQNVYVQLTDVTEYKCDGARSLIFAVAGDGNVNNVLLDWTISKYNLGNSTGWYPCGGITSIFVGGEIKNNVVIVSVVDEKTLERYAEMLEVNCSFGAFVGQKAPNTPDAVKNNYAVSALTFNRGIGGTADRTGCFKTIEELLQNADFSAGNGWNNLWNTSDDALKFGDHSLAMLENVWLKNLSANNITEGETLEYFAKAKFGEVKYEWKNGDEILESAPDKEGVYTLIARVEEGDNFEALEDEITVTIRKKIEKIAGEKIIEVNGSYYNFDILVGEKVTHIAITSKEEDKIAYSESFCFDNKFTFRGNTRLYLYTESGVKCVDAVFVDKAFTQADVATIWDSLNETPSGYYVLAGNIDFLEYPIEKSGTGFGTQGGGRSKTPSVNNCAVYSTFTGTFDGRGFGLYNLQIKATDISSNYTVVSVFGVVKGEIKNMYVQLIDQTEFDETSGRFGTGGRSFSYRIGGLNGSINNIFLDWTLQRYDLGNSTNYYPAGGITTVLETKDGARNNVVKMHVIHSEKLDEKTSKGSRSSLGGIAGQASFDCSAYLGTNYVIGDVSYLSLVGVQTWGEKTNTFKSAVAFIETVQELKTADGWSQYWKIENGILKFGAKTLESES